MFSQAYGNTRLARKLVWAALYVSGTVLFMASCALCAHTGNLLWLVLLMLAGDVGVAWYAIKQGYGFEWLLERRFRKTCLGLRGDFVSVKIQAAGNPFWVFGGSLTTQRPP